MDALAEFSIPVAGLKIGTHSFDFQIDSDFFCHFPDSLIKEGIFKVQLAFEKRFDIYELLFSFDGYTKTPCDRCLAEINFPVSGENRLLVKFADDFLEDAEVIYIPLKTEELNVAKYIYEYISLAIPLVKTYNCEAEIEKPCDEQMLAFIQKNKRDKKETSTPNPVWEELKNIKFRKV